MPTVNPRINVTLSPSLFGMVDELAKHQRVSKSMVLRAAGSLRACPSAGCGHAQSR